MNDARTLFISEYLIKLERIKKILDELEQQKKSDELLKIKKEGEIIDIKRFGNWLIISYRGKFGISFTKIRIEEKNENRN